MTIDCVLAFLPRGDANKRKLGAHQLMGSEGLKGTSGSQKGVSSGPKALFRKCGFGSSEHLRIPKPEALNHKTHPQVCEHAGWTRSKREVWQHQAAYVSQDVYH